MAHKCYQSIQKLVSKLDVYIPSIAQNKQLASVAPKHNMHVYWTTNIFFSILELKCVSRQQSCANVLIISLHPPLQITVTVM